MSIANLAKLLHTDRPQLIRATRDLQPPLELIEGKRILLSDVPRIETALDIMRKEKR